MLHQSKSHFSCYKEKYTQSKLCRTIGGQDVQAFNARADSDDSTSDANNSMNGLKQVQDDIVKMNTSMEDVKEQLKDVIKMIEVRFLAFL
jgi:hypothetical protein